MKKTIILSFLLTLLAFPAAFANEEDITPVIQEESQPQYNIVSETGTVIIVKSGDKYGLLDKESEKQIVEPILDEVALFDENIPTLFKVKVDNNIGYIDVTNNLKVLTPFDDISIINGYIKTKKGKKFGLMDLESNVIIPANYDKIEVIDSDDTKIIATKLGRKYKLFDIYGREIPDSELYKIDIASLEYSELINDLKPEIKNYIIEKIRKAKLEQEGGNLQYVQKAHVEKNIEGLVIEIPDLMQMRTSTKVVLKVIENSAPKSPHKTKKVNKEKSKENIEQLIPDQQTPEVEYDNTQYLEDTVTEQTADEKSEEIVQEQHEDTVTEPITDEKSEEVVQEQHEDTVIEPITDEKSEEVVQEQHEDTVTEQITDEKSEEIVQEQTEEIIDDTPIEASLINYGDIQFYVLKKKNKIGLSNEKGIEIAPVNFDKIDIDTPSQLFKTPIIICKNDTNVIIYDLNAKKLGELKNNVAKVYLNNKTYTYQIASDKVWELSTGKRKLGRIIVKDNEYIYTKIGFSLWRLNKVNEIFVNLLSA